MSANTTDETVVLSGGLAVARGALQLLWDLEARAFLIELDGDGFYVSPCSRLTPADDAGLRRHRDDILALVRYCARRQ